MSDLPMTKPPNANAQQPAHAGVALKLQQLNRVAGLLQQFVRRRPACSDTTRLHAIPEIDTATFFLCLDRQILDLRYKLDPGFGIGTKLVFVGFCVALTVTLDIC